MSDSQSDQAGSPHSVRGLFDTNSYGSYEVSTMLTQSDPPEECETLEDDDDQQKSEEGMGAFAEEKLKTYEELMAKKRKYGNRPDSLAKMNRLQLVCERIALMSVLLDYELKLVRPSSDYERIVMRPLYDRLEKILLILDRVPSFGKATSTLEEAIKTNPALEELVNKPSDVQIPKPLVVAGYEDPSKKAKGKKDREGFDDVVAKCENHPVVRKWLDSLNNDDCEDEDWKEYQHLSEKELQESLSEVLQKRRECCQILRNFDGTCTRTNRRAVDSTYDELEEAQRKIRVFEDLLRKKKRGRK